MASEAQLALDLRASMYEQEVVGRTLAGRAHAREHGRAWLAQRTTDFSALLEPTEAASGRN